MTDEEREMEKLERLVHDPDLDVVAWGDCFILRGSWSKSGGLNYRTVVLVSYRTQDSGKAS